MQQLLQQYGLVIFLGLMLLAMMVFSSRSRKKMLARQEEQQRQIAAGLVPGAWVKTVAGFWGRYVDEDGDVVILETTDGTETYWERASIRTVGEQPPFAADEAPEESAPEEEDKPVLGLDQPTSPAPTDDEDEKKS